MGYFKSKDCELKTGATVRVRTARIADAAALISHARSILEEGEFFISEPDEFDFTDEQEQDWIREHAEKPGDLILVAQIHDEIVGLLFFESGPRKRLAHRGIFHMSVSKEWRGRGVGTALLRCLLEWSTQSPVIEKLCLSVLATNTRAIGLYKKLGFVEEGRRPKEVKLGPGAYVDDILMCRFV